MGKIQTYLHTMALSFFIKSFCIINGHSKSSNVKYFSSVFGSHSSDARKKKIEKKRREKEKKKGGLVWEHARRGWGEFWIGRR